MKRFVANEDEIVTHVLTPWVGVTLSDGDRGAILSIGDSYRILCATTCHCGARNVVCGGRDSDGYSPEDVLYTWKDKYRNGDTSVDITDILCFDSYKELMTWFVEGIKE